MYRSRGEMFLFLRGCSELHTAQNSDFSSRPRADFFDCNFGGVGFEVLATVFYVQRKGVNINTAGLSLLAGPIFYSSPPSSCEAFGL